MSAKTPLAHLKAKKWCTASGSSNESECNSGAKSPEPNCAICLGKIEERSFTDRCFHCFCRTCLFEWSKVKPECPVCRQPFEKIIFNIRAMDDYEEHIVETQPRLPFHSSPFVAFANIDGVTRFRYPTTLTPLRRRMIDFERRLMNMTQVSDYARRFQELERILENHRRTRANVTSARSRPNIDFGDPPIDIVVRHPSHMSVNVDQSSARESLRSTYNPGLYRSSVYDLDIFPPAVGTIAHRRYIYDSDLWVMPNGDGNTARTCVSSARFYADNPACTHRIYRWLNRELSAVLSANEAEVLMPRIMNALIMYNITSREFKRIVAPYLLQRTTHFIHELYNFARSPYDMETYSRISQYVPRHRAQIVPSVSEPLPAPLGFKIEPSSRRTSSSSDDSSSSSSDSSIEILTVSQTSRPSDRSPDIFSIDSNDSSNSEAVTPIRNLMSHSPISSVTDVVIEDAGNVNTPHSPTPTPQGDLPDVNFGNINTIEDFDNPQPSTSGLNLRPPRRTKWTDSDTTDIDVGDELEAAIARYERKELNNQNEVKNENHLNENEVKVERNSQQDSHEIQQQNEQIIQNNVSDSDSDGSSVLIVGYVKPLHERTPEMIDLISDSDNDYVPKESKGKEILKKSKEKLKSIARVRSPPSLTLSERIQLHKRRCKHKSRDRLKDRHKMKRKHKHYRHMKHSHSRSSSSSNSSSTSSSSDDELRHLHEKYKKRRKHHKHHKRGKHFRDLDCKTDQLFDDKHRNDISDRQFNVPSHSASTSRTPNNLSSVVIKKQNIFSEPFKLNRFYFYSDSD